jgi:hypothetical protein
MLMLHGRCTGCKRGYTRVYIKDVISGLRHVYGTNISELEVSDACRGIRCRPGHDISLVLTSGFEV